MTSTADTSNVSVTNNPKGNVWRDNSLLVSLVCLIICVLMFVLFGYEVHNFNKTVYDPSGVPMADTSRGLIGTKQNSSDTGILAADWIISIVSFLVGLAAAGTAIVFVIDDGE